MKNPLRVLLPLFIVALMVTISVGIAFARETNFIGSWSKNQGLASVTVKSAPKGTNKLATNLLKSTGDKTTVLSIAPNVNKPSLVQQPASPSTASDSFSITYTGTVTSEKETDEIVITGTVETIAANSWTVSGQTFAVTTTTEIDGNIVVGDKVKVDLYYDQAHVLTAEQIELLTEEGHNTTTEFTGTVEAMSPVSITVSGRVLIITQDTEIDGNVVVGSKVKVEALVNPDGSLVAKQIELLENNDEGGGNCQQDECGNHQGEHDNQQGENQNHQGEHHNHQGEGDNQQGEQYGSHSLYQGDNHHDD